MSGGAEAQTRAQRIDPRVRQAGWNPIVQHAASQTLDGLRSTAIKEYPTANGPADYALCDRGDILRVVEAKKLTLGPQGVLPQAERYSRGIEQQPKYQEQYGVPFLYSTNGEVIHFYDARHVKTDGVSQSNINGSKLGAMPLPLPLFEEQREIVRRTTALFQTADTLLARIDAASRRVNRSTQAVLAKAFRGDFRARESETRS